VQKKPRTK